MFANNVYRLNTKQEIVEYYHAADSWPVKKSWISAIKRNVYASWLHLAEQLVRKHLTVQEPTNLGHINSRKLGTQSFKLKIVTNNKFEDELDIENNNLDPLKRGILQTCDRRIGAHIFSFDELKNYIATDLCGKYPTMSNRGMKYLFVLYNYNSNAILAKPMKSNKGAAIIEAYDSIYNKLIEAGIVPVLQYLDNEVSKELILSIK